MNVPPPLHTSEPGSFARDTLARRVPETLADTRARLEPLPPSVAAAFDGLATELRSGTLRALREPAPDRVDWDHVVAPHVGRSWLDLPWYFAEAYFWRRLLEATGYFGDGPLAGRDPFASHKAEEWAPHEGPRRCAELLASLPEEREARTHALLLGSLWGNRADLSYNVARALGAHAGGDEDVLVDDRLVVIERLRTRPPQRLLVIADNAGTELLMDLALIDHLLHGWRVPLVEPHLKPHPFFVSDAMPADVEAALLALAPAGPAAAALSTRLSEAIAEGRIRLRTDFFYTSGHLYRELPPPLRRDLAGADLVFLKGDANYRRLCDDARWPPETAFADIVAYFPAPLCALRTSKAELIVGLRPGQAERLSLEDPRWMVNGRRGVIQARL